MQVKGRYLQVLQVGVATGTQVQHRSACYSTCSFNSTSVLTHKPWWVGVRGIIPQHLDRFWVGINYFPLPKAWQTKAESSTHLVQDAPVLKGMPKQKKSRSSTWRKKMHEWGSRNKLPWVSCIGRPSVNIVIIVFIIVKFWLCGGYVSVHIAVCECSYGGQKTPSGSVMSSFYLVWDGV